MSVYRGGHIVRIKVINFMTYDELEIFPKHGLNLIIGLNGSGKSSIMCAICLGLAGKPQFTGRSVQLSDFIKYGCEKATIEIELDNLKSKNVVITRIIQSDKSAWFLNKKASLLNEVQNTVKKFNIDIGNLCQFLPQEKVSEFSKMDKKARLENMLQAIGEPHLYELFKELKKKTVRYEELEKDLKSFQKSKTVEDQKNERLKVDVDRQEQRCRLIEHLSSLKLHKMCWEYEEIRQQLSNVKNEIRSLQASISSEKEEIETINLQMSENASNIATNKDQLIKINKTVSQRQANISQCSTQLSKYQEMAQNAKIHYQNRIEEKRNQLQKLREIKQQKEGLEKLMEKSKIKLPIIEKRNIELIKSLEEYKNYISQLDSSLASINMEKNKLKFQIQNNMREIEMMKNEENKKMEFLKQRFRDVYEAATWLKQNEHKFKAPIHLPMLITLKIENEDNCKFIENSISRRDLVAFICEDKEDNKLLTQILRLHKKLNVNIVMAPDKPMQYYTSPVITAELRKMGVMCFLRDIISAPDAVIRFLCECYKIHLVPICRSDAQDNMNVILQRFRSFFTPTAKFSGKSSKYGARNFIVRKDEIKGRGFIPSSKDHSEQLQELMITSKGLQNELTAISDKFKAFEEDRKVKEREENAVREEKRAINEKLKEIQSYERQLIQKVQSFEQKRNEIIDEEVEKQNLLTTMQEINYKKTEILKELKNFLEDFLTFKEQKLIYNFKLRLLKKNCSNVSQLLNEKNSQLKSSESKLLELNEAKAEIKGRGIVLHNKIQEKVANKGNTSLLNKFSDSTKEETEKEIRRVQAQLEINSEDNESVLTEYKQRQLTIEDMVRKIEKVERDLKEQEIEITQKKNKWLPALQKHIRNINRKFSQYYKQLKCAGEIILDTCNDSNDFPKYGLQISLKYRDNEPFMELSNTHHSGGECSIAAVIFILSLQELTEVPFRCIDEINQGMDAQNERSMYALISDSAKNGSCSQYFLLTPKLLMDLEMIEQQEVNVHIIFNSSYLELPMDVSKHIELLDSSC